MLKIQLYLFLTQKSQIKGTNTENYAFMIIVLSVWGI